MKINRIIWLREYVNKIETKHGVYREEVRQALLSHPRIQRVGKGKRRKGEHLYVAYGQSDAGRYLVVFFIYKKAGNEALIISARDMDDKERRRYGRN